MKNVALQIAWTSARISFLIGFCLMASLPMACKKSVPKQAEEPESPRPPRGRDNYKAALRNFTGFSRVDFSMPTMRDQPGVNKFDEASKFLRQTGIANKEAERIEAELRVKGFDHLQEITQKPLDVKFLDICVDGSVSIEAIRKELGKEDRLHSPRSTKRFSDPLYDNGADHWFEYGDWIEFGTHLDKVKVVRVIYNKYR